MKHASAARSGYGSVFLRRISIHHANACMATFCGAAAFASSISLGAPNVVGVPAAGLFGFLAFLFVTATVPASGWHGAPRQPLPAAPPAPPAPVVAGGQRSLDGRQGSPSLVDPVREARASDRPFDVAVSQAVADGDDPFADLEAELSELARDLARTRRPRPVLAA